MNLCRSLKVLVIMILLACSTMKCTKQGFMSGDHLHSLLHMELIDRILECTGFAHVELAYLSMLVNFIKAWVEQHQRFLGLLPTEV